jgi:hypothetical protein
MPVTTFDKFDGQYFCAKRDKTMDYHKLAKMRAQSCTGNTLKCGSKNDTDRQFCMPQATISGAATCLPNNLEVLKSNGTSNGVGFTNIGANMAYEMDSDDNFKNPISNIIYAISAPCSNLAIDYVARPIPIGRLVKDRQSCALRYGEMDAHPLFYPTSYG